MDETVWTNRLKEVNAAHHSSTMIPYDKKNLMILNPQKFKQLVTKIVSESGNLIYFTAGRWGIEVIRQIAKVLHLESAIQEKLECSLILTPIIEHEIYRLGDIRKCDGEFYSVREIQHMPKSTRLLYLIKIAKIYQASPSSANFELESLPGVCFNEAILPLLSDLVFLDNSASQIAAMKKMHPEVKCVLATTMTKEKQFYDEVCSEHTVKISPQSFFLSRIQQEESVEEFPPGPQ